MEKIRSLREPRLHDFVVMGRFTHPNGLPPDLLRLVLVGCGRPIMIASTSAPRASHTLMVAWKDTREAARALTAAMPLLTEVEKVVVAEVVEGHPSANDAATVATQLRWHGLRAERRTIRADGHPVAASLSSAAEACMPIFSSWEAIVQVRCEKKFFGGCTKSMLDHAPVPGFVL